MPWGAACIGPACLLLCLLLGCTGNRLRASATSAPAAAPAVSFRATKGKPSTADAVTLGDTWLQRAIAEGLIQPIPNARQYRWWVSTAETCMCREALMRCTSHSAEILPRLVAQSGGCCPAASQPTVHCAPPRQPACCNTRCVLARLPAGLTLPALAAAGVPGSQGADGRAGRGVGGTVPLGCHSGCVPQGQAGKVRGSCLWVQGHGSWHCCLCE